MAKTALFANFAAIMANQTTINESLSGCGVYVVHALKGYEMHEARLHEVLGKLGIAFELVTEGDVSLFTDELLHAHFTPELIATNKLGVISCTLNHMMAYRRLLASENQYALVLENDPCILRNFEQRLSRTMQEVRLLEPGFIVSLENTSLTAPSVWQTRRNRVIYRAICGRMAGAYLIDRKGAANALADLQQHKCNYAVDWWHYMMCIDNVLRMYWAHPPLFEQGSHNGLLQGPISTRSKSLKRRINFLIQKYFKYSVRRLFPNRYVIPD